MVTWQVLCGRASTQNWRMASSAVILRAGECVVAGEPWMTQEGPACATAGRCPLRRVRGSNAQGVGVGGGIRVVRLVVARFGSFRNTDESVLAADAGVAPAVAAFVCVVGFVVRGFAA